MYNIMNSKDCECMIIVVLGLILLFWVVKPLIFRENMIAKILNGNDVNASNDTRYDSLDANQMPIPGSVPAFNNCAALGVSLDKSKPSLVDGKHYGMKTSGLGYPVDNELDGYLGATYYFLDTGENQISSLGDRCSSSCCSNQYPTPFGQESSEAMVDGNKYVKSRMYCNNSNDSAGCLCLNKDNAYMIQNRGYPSK
jgi:hypothetical protein